MTLYTNMPLELVLDGIHEKAEAPQEVYAHGIKMQVTPVAPGIGKIVRLLDCSLDDYLNPNLTPGTLVSYRSTPN
ncbi:YlzJ-like family protein [Paenibacillus arenilitoris]|uniref:YlzJ-like family protein n=1 Tax=Paenibacillus arenilitoris TaxID=2772299 RepID=A0A927H7I3_9BACL|nr:YlzJ-like family protein [Paenibacillus arenilitoris]MBD2870678.1 YlzJ-like family protein [Paenibacillus arenilitoris]